MTLDNGFTLVDRYIYKIIDTPITVAVSNNLGVIKNKYIIKDDCVDVESINMHGHTSSGNTSEILWTPIVAWYRLGFSEIQVPIDKIKVLRYPLHGVLSPDKEDNYSFYFLPNLGFQGNDLVVTQFIVGNNEYTVYTTLAVYPNNLGYTNDFDGECTNKLKMSKPKILKLSLAMLSYDFS